MNYYLDVIKKYATFEGRARRKEYWMFVLFNFIIACILGVIDQAAGWSFEAAGSEIGILGTIYALFVLIPSLAVSVRRLHDIEKSGWAILWGLIPVVGTIILLVYTCKAGTVGENKYGADPKEQAE